MLSLIKMKSNISHIIIESKLFDASWYLKQNPDVARAGLNPLMHYLSSGAAEGRDPHPLFDASWYLDCNPDVAQAGLNPLIHFLNCGGVEGRDPHPLFDASWYLDRNPDVAKAGLNPLIHYLSDDGLGRGANPNRYFDRSWYLATYPDISKAGIEPLIHYLQNGASEARDPGPLFQTGYYVASNQDVAAIGLNPLAHFLRSGEAEGRQPHSLGKAFASDDIPLTSYPAWIDHHSITDAHAELQRRVSANSDIRPLISLVVPVYSVQAEVFDVLVGSVFEQTYPYWELCISVSYFDDEKLLESIDNAAKADNRVKVRRLEANRGISHNTNDALALATGTFIGLLDHDDALSREALYEVVQAIEHEEADLYYSDKDAITEDGLQHFNPLFKAGWSPETMLSANYLTHFNVIRRSFIDMVGGWDPATDGAQDWDLFLRVVNAGARVRHIPKVLYHWRHVATSVAARGLAAKPYAARSQLVTLSRCLESRGLEKAEPFFTPKGFVRIKWNKAWAPRVAVLLLGEGKNETSWRKSLDVGMVRYCSDIVYAGTTLQCLSEAVNATAAEIIVVAPAAMCPRADWLEELVAPLEDKEIVAVSGKVLDPDGRVFDAGWVGVDGEWKPIFRGADEHTYSIFGSVDWFRNYSTISLNGTAFRKADFTTVGGLYNGKRPDLDLGVRLVAGGRGRIVYNPFAISVLEAHRSFERLGYDHLYESPPSDELDKLSRSDPYFNANLILDVRGTPVLRPMPIPQIPASHDYESEATYFGNRLDYAKEKSGGSTPDINKATSHFRGPVRIAWIVPNFTMPFYGGLMTILRCAEHLRIKGITPVFIGCYGDNVAALRRAIALAFPELATAAEVYVLGKDEDLDTLEMAPLDGAFCTLWTTAFVLKKLSVRHKFYFVQDYEPLFYPAGTTSSLVEATYKFGFFGICNTEPLKQLYEVFGSPADFFNPAVDPAIFHDRHRTEKNATDPVILFSYARPGHPRNCFEILAPALAEVKSRFKDSVLIFTAGANWSPADYGLEKSVEHLGILPYTETGDLYRACDVGLVAMATCHPSYLPFELMSAGAVVCTNFNRYTGWLLEHDKNCYQFDLAKTSIVNALSTVIVDPELRRRLSANGRKTISQNYSSWEASFDRVHRIITDQLGLEYQTTSSV